MQKSIIKVGPLGKSITTSRIRQVLKSYIITKLSIWKDYAYIEIGGGQIARENLGFQFGDMKIKSLGNAEIEKIDSEFLWPQQSMSSSSSAEDLTEFQLDNLIIIKCCDTNITKELSYNSIKKDIFFKFSSVNRIFNRQSYIIIEMLSPYDRENLQKQFIGMKVSKLGPNAYIDTIDQNYDIKELSQRWKLIGKQKQNIESDSNIPLLIQQRQNQINYLHQDSLPKLEHATSFQQNFEKRSSFNDLKIKWESGKIKVDNLNNKDHIPLTTIVEDHQIQNKNQHKSPIKQAQNQSAYSYQLQKQKPPNSNIFSILTNMTSNSNQIQKNNQNPKRDFSGKKGSSFIFLSSLLIWTLYILTQ